MESRIPANGSVDHKGNIAPIPPPVTSCADVPAKPHTGKINIDSTNNKRPFLSCFMIFNVLEIFFSASRYKFPIILFRKLEHRSKSLLSNYLVRDRVKKFIVRTKRYPDARVLYHTNIIFTITNCNNIGRWYVILF